MQPVGVFDEHDLKYISYCHKTKRLGKNLFVFVQSFRHGNIGPARNDG